MELDSLFKFDIAFYNTLLIPKNIYQRILYRQEISGLKRNKELQGVNNKTIYICGNGPSLKKVDFTEISDDYLVVNDFFRFQGKDLSHPPKYYLILDDIYLQNGMEERFNGVFDPGFETKYIISCVMQKEVLRRKPELRDSIYFFCPFGKLYNHKREVDFSRVHSRTWNVVSEAILFAIYAGYTDIRLLGCDYSVFASNAHFYSTIQNHPSLRVMLYKYCYSTHVHYEIRKYADSHNIKITNLTKETLLDAYDIDLNSKY